MAQINKPNLHFNTKLYSGNSSTNAITGVGFQPDLVWLKRRTVGVAHHLWHDVVRGKSGDKYYYLESSSTIAQNVQGDADGLSTLGSDGFTLTYNDSGAWNVSGSNYVSWNFKAGGTAPSKTYTVKVVSDSGNKYRFDDFGTSAVTLELSEGGTYTFDQSDSSNSGHPLRFSTTSDGTHNSGTEYTTGVTTTGTPGSSGAKTVITVASSAPTLYYYCSAHSGMGGTANTPTTNSFSDFSGSVQSNVSPNTTAGFSVVTVSNLNSNSFGHGLGAEPHLIINKRTDNVANWRVYYKGIASGKSLFLNTTAVPTTEGSAIASATSSTVTVTGSGNGGTGGTGDTVYYCFAPKKGFSKIGTYIGNGNSNGAFIYTGFKPAWVMIKNLTATANWLVFDTTRDSYNESGDTSQRLEANNTDIEDNGNSVDFVSNGFKLKNTGVGNNTSGSSYLYLAFAEQPLVGTNNIPATAR
jgi:hypothetical protein